MRDDVEVGRVIDHFPPETRVQPRQYVHRLLMVGHSAGRNPEGPPGERPDEWLTFVGPRVMDDEDRRDVARSYNDGADRRSLKWGYPREYQQIRSGNPTTGPVPGDGVPPLHPVSRTSHWRGIGIHLGVSWVQQGGILMAPGFDEDIVAAVSQGSNELTTVLRYTPLQRRYSPNVRDFHAPVPDAFAIR